ncbi:MAG TPA: hypothetical protein VLF93_02025 [Candidatus Saccharimonadales bacterium]|nr:hypothetical protein [Candidatus Saccharimonadales bacterium]
MVTALTVGLSVAARSITNTRTSQASSNSEEAFSAAEAGIEQSLALITPAPVNGSFTNNASYKTSVISVAGTSFAMNNGSPILQDQPADLWLSTYPSYSTQFSGNFTVYWGKSTDVCNSSPATNTMAALEILVLSGTTANPQISHFNVDPCNARSVSNKFTAIAPGGGTVSGTNYAYSTTIPITNGLFARILPLYAPTNVAVTGCNAANTVCNPLPAQGTVIQSIGTSQDTKRELVTYRYYPSLPSEIFQYNFFASQ